MKICLYYKATTTINLTGSNEQQLMRGASDGTHVKLWHNMGDMQHHHLFITWISQLIFHLQEWTITLKIYGHKRMKTLYFATISSVQIYSPIELEYLTAAFCNHTATDQADTQASQSHHFGMYFSPPHCQVSATQWIL